MLAAVRVSTFATHRERPHGQVAVQNGRDVQAWTRPLTSRGTLASLPRDHSRVHITPGERFGLCRLLERVAEVRRAKVSILQVRHANIFPRAHHADLLACKDGTRASSCAACHHEEDKVRPVATPQAETQERACWVLAQCRSKSWH